MLNRKSYSYLLFTSVVVPLLLMSNGCVTTSPQPSMSVAKPIAMPANERLRKLKKIAVLVHLNKPRYRPDTTTSRLIEDNIIEIVLQKGYRVPSRSDLAKVMTEIKLQNSSLTSNRDVAKIGKILNVPGMFIVHVAKLDRSRSGKYYRNFITLSGRMIDTETSEILWIKSVSGSANEQDASASDVIASLASQLANKL